MHESQAMLVDAALQDDDKMLEISIFRFLSPSPVLNQMFGGNLSYSDTGSTKTSVPDDCTTT